MNVKYQKPVVLKELHCPYCCGSIGVIGEITEIYHQHTDYCKKCRCEFTVNNFKAKTYIKLGGAKNG